MTNIRETIAQHDLFRGMKPEHLWLVAQNARETRFQAGEILLRETEPANRFFLVHTGTIALEAHAPGDGTVQVETIGPGGVLGWSWLFPPFTWHFRARAREDGTATVLDGASLLVCAEQNHDFGYELMKRISQVVIHRLNAARERLLAAEVESAFEG